MAFKKFDQSDIIHNRLKMHPKVQFDIHNGNIYYQNRNNLSGAFATSVPNVPTGYINLYELNVDRTQADTGLIYPFITKEGTLTSFRTVSTNSFNQDFNYGEIISGSYPLSASITRQYYNLSTVASRRHIYALKNTLNYNKRFSESYAFSSSARDLSTANINTIYVPSIFFGSSMQKGTVELNYYSSGSLIARLTDSRQNGQLIQTSGSISANDDSIAGVCLYDQGVILLTGSWNVSGTKTWLDFAEGANDGATPPPEDVYNIKFNGTTYTNTTTLLAHAEKGEFNYSSNPSYVKYDEKDLTPMTSSYGFVEREKTIKNTVFSPYADPTGSFEKTTYISKIGIYDENRNLIAIANLATPVKKTEERDFTFKLKLDI